MIIIKKDRALRAMREAGRLTARVRDSVVEKIAPGITTKEIADYAGGLIERWGGESAFYNYRGFPGRICISVNCGVVHGVPGDRRIELGDIVSLDIGVRYKGYLGDTATTVMVGVTAPEVIRLVRTTEEALRCGIAKAVSGGRVSDISHAIQKHAEQAGYSVVRQFVGHGIGRDLHEDPQVPNFGAAGKGARLRRGMTLAIEPMVNMGTHEVDVLEDGWTVLTQDRLPSAHFEHTVAVMDGEAEILTLSD